METNNSFFAALKAESDKVNQARVVKQPQALAPVNDNAPTINFVLNRQRIDLLFPERPSEFILQSLRDAGFHYRPSDKAWYHADYAENRKALQRMFPGSEIELEETESPTIDANAVSLDNPMPMPVLAYSGPVAPLPVGQVADRFPTVKVDAPVDTLIELPEFEVYKEQCDKLSRHYGLDFADLALLAIDALHKATFR